MTGSSVFLYVGATTLAAAVVTLCALQITATRMTSKKSRRHRALEEPVPGRRSLSSIGLDTESSRNTPSSRHQGLQPVTPVETAKDSGQGLRLSTPPAPSTSPITTQGKLNSLQTIQARSAALRPDGPPGKLANPKPPIHAAPPTPRPNPRAIPVQEQSSTALHATSVPEKPGITEAIPSSAAPVADSVEPAIAPRTSTSRRAKRANTQNQPVEIPHSASNQAPTDTPSDLIGSEPLDTLQSMSVGGSTSQEPGVLDIFAGLTEAEAGIQGLTDDLSDIDGGGLPSAPQKTPQKSRR